MTRISASRAARQPGVLGWLFELPFALLRTFGIEKAFGFNRMTPRLYLADTVREAALAALIGLPLLAAVLWLTLAMGELWWAWVWAFAWLQPARDGDPADLHRAAVQQVHRSPTPLKARFEVRSRAAAFAPRACS